MTEVKKIKYKNVDRYNSVAVLADKMWPLCTLDSWSEFHQEGELDKLFHWLDQYHHRVDHQQ